MRLNELRDTSYEIAKSKGWHDDDLKRSFADLMALVISELAEALEEHRKGVPPGLIYFSAVAPWPGVGVVGSRENLMDLAADGKKPEGVIIELADALIRIGDCAGEHGLDLDASSLSHLEREPEIATVGKRPVGDEEEAGFSDHFCEVCESLLMARAASILMRPSETLGDRSYFLTRACVEICCMAHSLGVTGEELERAIEIKHAYNRTRSNRHGGKRL